MHDVMEGVANDVISKLLLKFIEDNFFSARLLSNVLKSMDFGFESTNVPLEISLDYVKNKNRMRMSASELIFFVRYFGIMIGEYVPENNEYWLLYIKLREIVSIVTSPNVTHSHLLQLKIFIVEHHTLYMKLFGDLKSKFHILIHYVRIMLLIGPVIHVSAIRFESKHRDIKAIVHATASRKNILKTVSIRHQLSLMRFQYLKYKKFYVTNGPEEGDDVVHICFPSAQTRKTLTYIIINDVTYKTGTIIVADICDSGPCFGKIDMVFVVDDVIYFRYIPFKIIGFNYHFYAYSVIADITARKIVQYESMPLRGPYLLAIKNNISYIVTRHVL